jgi:hypothetical protein
MLKVVVVETSLATPSLRGTLVISLARIGEKQLGRVLDALTPVLGTQNRTPAASRSAAQQLNPHEPYTSTTATCFCIQA